MERCRIKWPPLVTKNKFQNGLSEMPHDVYLLKSETQILLLIRYFYLVYMILFELQCSQLDGKPHFTEEETKAQRNKVTCPTQHQ